MAEEKFYFGAVSSDLRNAVTADNVSIVSLWNEVGNLLPVWNRRMNQLNSLLAFRTTNPEADVVMQASAKWMREAEHTVADPRLRLRYELAVTTGLESFGAALEWTDFAQVVALDAATIKAFVRAILEENARMRFKMLLQQYFTSATRLVTDKLKRIQVTVTPFYAGAVGDLPAPVGNLTFADAHQHFLRSATTTNITAADLEAWVTTVQHHGFTGRCFIMGNQAAVDEIMSIGDPDIAKIYVQNPLIPNDAVNINQAGALMAVSVNLNGYEQFKQVGVFRGKADILVSDIIPAGYVGVFVHGGPNSMLNPLQMREPKESFLQGIRREQVRSPYPFVHTEFKDYFGVGVRQRGAGMAAQYIYTGANTDPYVAPTWDEDLY